MKKSLLNQMMPSALAEAEKLVVDGKIPGPYKGYIAAFGPSVLQMGLGPAVFRYSGESKEKEIGIRDNGKEGEDAGRKKVLNGLYAVLCAHTDGEKPSTMLGYVKGLDHGQLRAVQEHVLHACVALKLAMNTFPYDKKE